MSESFYDEEELDEDLYDDESEDEDEDYFDEDEEEEDGLDEPEEDIDGEETYNPDEEDGEVEDDELGDPALVDNMPKLLTDISLPIGEVVMDPGTGNVTISVSLDFEEIPGVVAYEVNPPLV